MRIKGLDSKSDVLQLEIIAFKPLACNHKAKINGKTDSITGNPASNLGVMVAGGLTNHPTISFIHK